MITKKKGFTLIEVTISITLMCFLLLSTMNVINNIYINNTELSNSTTNLANTSLALKEIVAFLDDNDGLMSSSDITENTIKARGNTRYVDYSTTSKALFVNKDGSTVSSNTAIPLDNVSFSTYTTIYGHTVLIVKIKTGNTTTTTAYPINLR